ncbi:MAG: hypothetical protein AB7I27_01560 [Bacteriovoracaceae bacterium]
MKILILAATLLSLSSEASNCAKDKQKFCQSVQPGKGQLARCLSDYQGQLSPLCAEELKNYKKDALKKNACFEDLAEYCTDVPSESLELCLLKYENRLSRVCATDFAKKKNNLMVRNVCAQAVVNLCYSDINGPEGAVTHCLIKNRNRLNGNCLKSIDERMASFRKKNPCFDETMKFCPTQVKFIDIQECMEKKISSLSPQCKSVVENEFNKSKANPCYRDLMRHCRPNISPSEQRDCLELNSRELSMACTNYRKQEEKKLDQMVNVCEQDRLKLCPKAPFQDGKILKCLKQNKTKVSAECKKFL